METVWSLVSGLAQQGLRAPDAGPGALVDMETVWSLVLPSRVLERRMPGLEHLLAWRRSGLWFLVLPSRVLERRMPDLEHLLTWRQPCRLPKLESEALFPELPAESVGGHASLHPCHCRIIIEFAACPHLPRADRFSLDVHRPSVTSLVTGNPCSLLCVHVQNEKNTKGKNVKIYRGMSHAVFTTAESNKKKDASPPTYFL